MILFLLFEKEEMELYKEEKKRQAFWLGDKEEMWVTVKVIKLRKQESLRTALTRTHFSKSSLLQMC